MGESPRLRESLADGGIPSREVAERPASSLRVLVAAESRLYREGLACALRSRADGAGLVALPCEGEVVPAAERAGVDVLLVDVSAPSGITTLRTVRDAAPGLPLLALGVGEGEPDVMACAEAGAAGFVSKDASLDELLAAIRSVVRGELHCSPRVAGQLFRRVAALAAERPQAGESARLTPREREVSRLLDEGLSNKQIARELHIQLSTVKNHVHNILDKLKVRRRGEAVAKARREQTVPGRWS